MLRCCSIAASSTTVTLACWWPPFLGAHQDYKGRRWLHDYSRGCKPLTATTFHSLVALGLSCLRCMGLTPRVRVWFLGGVAAGPGCCCCSHASCWQISLCTQNFSRGKATASKLQARQITPPGHVQLAGHNQSTTQLLLEHLTPSPPESAL